MGIFDFLRRDVSKISFSSFIGRVEKSDGYEVADRIRDNAIDILLRDAPNLTLSDIERMKWGDVAFRIKRFEKKQLDELAAIDKILAIATQQPTQDTFTSDPGWSYSLENIEDYR